MEQGKKVVKEMTLKSGILGFAIPIILMLILILCNVSLTIAMFIAVVALVIFGYIMNHKWDELEEAMSQGIKSIASASVVMILVGGLIGVFMAAGTIPAMLFYGFKIINPTFFLPIAFILSALVALSTGTSWGSIGTIGVVMIGMAAGLNIPLAYAAGAIISGAMFGDKMSPLSDTTLLAAASAQTTVFKHIIAMFYTTVPATVLCLILYYFLGISSQGTIDAVGLQALNDGLSSAFNIHLGTLIPLVVILGLSIKQVPAFITFSVSILVAAVCAVLFQSCSIMSVFDYTMYGYVSSTGVESLDGLLSRGGISSMLEMISVLLMAGMLSGLIEKLGVLTPIVKTITAKVHTTGGIVTATLGTVGIVALSGAQYPALTIPALAFKSTFDEMDIHPCVLSRSMEDVGTILCALLPYGISAAYYSGTLGVEPMAYIPFTLFPMLCVIISLINAWFGIGVFRKDDNVTYNPLWRRSKQ